MKTRVEEADEEEAADKDAENEEADLLNMRSTVIFQI